VLCRKGIPWQAHSTFSRSLSGIPGIEAAVIQIEGEKSSLLVASVYVHPGSPKDSIQRLFHFAETHGIILAGDFNAKGLFNCQADVTNSAGREVDVLFQWSFFAIPSFPEKPTFTRILESGNVQAYILDGVFAPSENSLIELDELLFELNGDHLPVCFTITTPDHFLISQLPDVAPPKFTMSQHSLPFFSKSIEARSSSLLLLSTTSIPAEFDSLVTSMTEAINACMRDSLCRPPPQTPCSVLGQPANGAQEEEEQSQSSR